MHNIRHIRYDSFLTLEVNDLKVKIDNLFKKEKNSNRKKDELTKFNLSSSRLVVTRYIWSRTPNKQGLPRSPNSIGHLSGDRGWPDDATIVEPVLCEFPQRRWVWFHYSLYLGGWGTRRQAFACMESERTFLKIRMSRFILEQRSHSTLDVCYFPQFWWPQKLNEENKATEILTLKTICV